MAAARELLASGITPTVEQAADRAAISRTTAYRYFVNQRALLTAAYPIIETPSLLGAAPPDDPAERFELIVERFIQQVLTHETELRAMLRLSLDPSPPDPAQLPLRQGRAIGWIEQALAPVRGRVSGTAFRRLLLSVRATTGIEALVWLCDVANLSREEAAEVMTWSARALFDTTMRERDRPRRKGTVGHPASVGGTAKRRPRGTGSRGKKR